MKALKDLKKGDKAVVYRSMCRRNNDDEAREVIVSSVGRVWIKVVRSGGGYEQSFSLETGELKDWCAYILYPGSMKEYKQWVEECNNAYENLKMVKERLRDIRPEKDAALIAKLLKLLNS